MAAKGSVTLSVVGDVDNAKQKFRELGAEVDNFGRKAANSGERLSKIGKTMSVAVTLPVIAGLTAATAAASNLEQSVGAVESVFGEARGPIEEFGKTAAQAAGLSEREVNEMAATLGASLQGLGFDVADSAKKVVDLEKRAADMAATFGGPTSEAIGAIGALMRGEADPIERFGVSIKDADVQARILALGLDTSTTAAEKKAGAIARLDLLMQQTAKTEGAFAREADSAAGAQARASAELENAAATLGEKLLPLAAKGASAVADLAAGFASLPPAIQNGVIALGGLVALSGPVLTMAGNVKNLGTAIKALSFASIGGGAAAFIGLGAAVAGAGVAWTAYQSVMEGARDLQTKFDTDIATGVNMLAVAEENVIGYKDAVAEAAVELYVGGAAARGWGDDLEEVGRQGEVASRQVEEARVVIDRLAEASGVSRMRVAQLASEMGINLARATDEQKESLSGALTQIDRAVTPTEKLAEAQAVLGNEFRTAAEEVDAFKAAIDAALGTVLSADEASINYRQAVLNLAQEIAEGSREGEGAQEVQDRLAESLIGVVGAAEKEVEALDAAGQISGGAAEKKQILIDKLNHLRTIMPELNEQLARYIYLLASIPDPAQTAAEQQQSSEARREAAARDRPSPSTKSTTAVIINIDAQHLTPAQIFEAANRAAGWALGAVGGQ